MSTTSVRGLSVALVERNHLDTTAFRTAYADRIFGAGDRPLSDYPTMNTCALRVSMALHLTGVRLPRVINSWKYAPATGSPTYLPSLASDFHDRALLSSPESITGPADITDRSGIVLFKGGFTTASGHITVCNAGRFHLNDTYWSQASSIYFWPF